MPSQMKFGAALLVLACALIMLLILGGFVQCKGQPPAQTYPVGGIQVGWWQLAMPNPLLPRNVTYGPATEVKVVAIRSVGGRSYLIYDYPDGQRWQAELRDYQRIGWCAPPGAQNTNEVGAR